MSIQSTLTGIFLGFKDSILGIYAIRGLNTGDPNADNHRSKTRKSKVNTLQKILHCYILNGGIFGVSLLVFDFVLLPLLYTFLQQIFGSQPTLLSSTWYWMEPFLSHIFSALWRIPRFLVTRVINAFLFQDIADSTFKGRPSFLKSIPVLIADSLFSCVIQALFLLQGTIISLLPVPFMREMTSLFHLSLLYALYSFEYKWFNMGWELHRRLQVIESNWPYFFGFGLPLAILTSFSDSYLVSGCIFSLLFPLFIISGNEAKPKYGSQYCEYPLRIFRVVVWFSNKLFQSTLHMTNSNQIKPTAKKVK